MGITIHLFGQKCQGRSEQGKAPLIFRKKPSYTSVMRKKEEGTAPQFVVHEHHASRLHYDFRLEIAGVLKSWAIPKGPSMNPAEKRLAVMVDDHSLVYGSYEGIIPDGQYGAGPVVIWDSGTYTPLEEGDPGTQVLTGRLLFTLDGKKLKGGFTLMRLARGGTGKEWLLIKKKDQYAIPDWRVETALTPEKLRTLLVKKPPCESA